MVRGMICSRRKPGGSYANHSSSFGLHPRRPSVLVLHPSKYIWVGYGLVGIMLTLAQGCSNLRIEHGWLNFHQFNKECKAETKVVAYRVRCDI